MKDEDLGNPSIAIPVEGVEEHGQGSAQGSVQVSNKDQTPEGSAGGPVNEDDPEFNKITELHLEMGVLEEKILKLTNLLGEIEKPDDKSSKIA